ncbi:MAG: helix-turn-helix transcriptional regulator [Furfurilactobacillus sp.]|jgi:DNA-binding HxlR family transcriptional regulator|uniref:Helix-turn-helix transcriptional regulator n=1 Tax=Furfurilactobacillus milii TaxID=2888272 RepID=A0ABT6DA73_9LACO|nr:MULTISPECIES: helix-turn-helix domain-containing protein [Furfurilactobacillus]QLE67675.1 Transcriptional regulator HxlR [Furfurilactobacillus rossiae]MCF6160473.1 helix-turn-helix transcriptional regulator [Furfurilactobacillus milii]MCF6162705.1 helix-turn-helix transcriptional regulator [Furfurilactobacillus milii]MCF6418286.1 helix-turn-helix transcriptional regulator [Furfurilactobacillus milii]MCH4011804.1 helix-turn-helix transcriptional regulator [Furfurilactobacillus sp.]
MAKTYNIGVEATLEVIGGKWKPIILCHLGKGQQRSSELRREIPDITQKVLTQQLRELESDGIIVRHVHGTKAPFCVTYDLTAFGKTLGGILVQMSVWGERRIEQLNEAGEPVEILNPDHSGYADILNQVG